RRTSTWICKCAKINHTSSNFRRHHCLSPHCSSIFTIYFHRLISSFPGDAGAGFCPRRKQIDETVFHLGSVCHLDRLRPRRAAARDGANLHLTRLRHQNCSHYTDSTKASANQPSRQK